MALKEDSTTNANPYSTLPYLDSIHQATGINGTVNNLKKPLRLAVNANRVNLSGMKELIHLLEETLEFITQVEDKPKRKKRVSKPTPKKEYDLP